MNMGGNCYADTNKYTSQVITVKQCIIHFNNIITGRGRAIVPLMMHQYVSLRKGFKRSFKYSTMLSNLDLFVDCCRADCYKSRVPAELSCTLWSFNREHFGWNVHRDSVIAILKIYASMD
jgi:hypothetical protein